jgi:ubiquinone/menaquinone biosynthesis C-methylase UbiE
VLDVAKRAAAPARPPRAVAWVLVLTSGTAVLLVGLAGTLAILSGAVTRSAVIPTPFWIRLLGACGLTIASLELRSLRWVFLLRRTETRIPIRDAYIGYLAGLSLLLTPVLVGEIGVRAWILRARGGVPVATTALVNLWERLLDLVALAAIAGVLGLTLAGPTIPAVALLIGVVTLFARPVRIMCLALAAALASVVGRRVAREDAPPHVESLARTQTWLVALAASVVAWTLPGIGFWLVARSWSGGLTAAESIHTYARSTGWGALLLAPGGVLVTGRQMLESLAAVGLSAEPAALAVFATRLATAGVATVLGIAFVVVHRRAMPAAHATHFDDIAHAYDVQIPEARRLALVERKTRLMQQAIARAAVGRRGLDVGCGQGAYIGEMRRLGFDVTGIDDSAGQVAIATARLGRLELVTTGSALDIPTDDQSFDFVYAINVLHHLASVDDQRRAFRELLRVLRPGGLLFVHEINTRNVLFRFYMGYVFPSLNCIDEGVERWLLPDELSMYTSAPVTELHYFTFLPEFLPAAIVRMVAPLERLLEVSPLRSYSAHYMAVLRKPE